ncbi:MAG: 4Fe-4S dicluster domain-containing protein [Pirellulales bacterium]|nr:4Fe-4S dicluster domain-containing protein [Pirellulales bacterium]
MTNFQGDMNGLEAAVRPNSVRPSEGAVPNEALPALNRRQFLEAAGFTFTLATLGGCGRAPVGHALPPASLPDGAIPGNLRYYASTCTGCSAECGMLVGTRDGRPLKMEGLPEHPLSRGGLCAVGQAQTIGLYDSLRLKGPLLGGKESDWPSVDKAILQALKQLPEGRGSVRLVTPSITSPTLHAVIDKFLKSYSDAKHVVFDPVSSSAILEAHAATHAARVLPHYRLDRADVVVSFGADFLGTWISPVEFTAAWSSRRAPEADRPKMSHHVQFESRLSLTGSNADQRYAVRPEEYGPLVARLTELVASRAGQPISESLAPSPDERHANVLENLAERLWNARGKCLVVSDSQDVAVQRLINYANHLLGNYGTTVDLAQPSRQRQGQDRDVEQLIGDLRGNRIGALLVADLDLLHDLACFPDLAEAIDRIPLTISFAPRVDSFASHAKFVCPAHHPLESWGDSEPIAGLVSLAQPTLMPLADTRSMLESLATWSGTPTSALDAIQAHWKESFFPRRRIEAVTSFHEFWDNALRDGFVELKTDAGPNAEFATSAVKPLVVDAPSESFTVVLHRNVAMPSVLHAHNPWLQELPDPVTKVTWGNCVAVSPNDADQLGIHEGDIVVVASEDGQSKVELPALVQVGQADGVLAIALGYGGKGTERFAKIGPQWIGAKDSVSEEGLVGANASGLLRFQLNSLRYQRSGVSVTKTAGRRPLATTQRYHSLEMPREIAPRGAEHREIVQHTTLAAFAKNPEAGAVEHHVALEPQLWPEDHPTPGHAWGMVIDLNKCTGCSACVVACQAENNVPVVGYDEVLRQREMHWLRIDRYYSGENDSLQVAHQPMMCQHCGNAPCETVCPALATVHSSEGLNEQVYNRCVGTRYCANNCPYKVRRFNWFEYPHPDLRQNLVLNPEVTVRSRGVMEKCSMCVQRIEAGRIEARGKGLPIADGAIQTACQQSCPAQAIVFGDMNDPKTAIHAAMKNPRRYRVLEELNVRPAVSYLRVVTNRDEETRRG